MDHLLGLCTLFLLFLTSSSFSNFCGLRYLDPKLDKANNVSSEHREAPEAPWLVNIYGNGHRCQGVILSSWWVLTAANCFLLMNPSQVELTGSHGHFSTKTVNQFLLHRGFSSWNKAPNNDLGLILLGQPVDLTIKDMWPACIPQKEKPYNTQEECRIFEQGQSGSMRWLLKQIMVKALTISDCSKYWSNTTGKRNLCIARKGAPKLISCKVPVGSPVICHDPATLEWEVMGLVSQSLHNCKVPILASQLLSHLQWLKQVGALQNPPRPKDKLPSTAGQQPVTLLEPITVQTPSATLEVPVTPPVTKQAFKLPSPKADITATAHTITTATTEFPSTNLSSLEATMAATVASPLTKPPALETIATVATTLSLSQIANQLSAASLSIKNSILHSSKAAKSAQNLTAAHESSPITSASFSPTTEPHGAPASPGQLSQEISSISQWSTTAGMASTTLSHTSKQKSSVTSTTTHQSPSIASSTIQKSSVTIVTTNPFSQTPKPEHVVGITAGQPPQTTSSISGQSTVVGMPSTIFSFTPTQQSSITSTITHQSPSVTSSTPQKSSVTMVTTKPFSQTPKPELVVHTTAGQLPQETSSISGQSTAAGAPSTILSFTPTGQSSVTSTTTHQSPSVASSTTQKSSVTTVTTNPFSQTPKPEHVVGITAGQPPQATSSISGQSTVVGMPSTIFYFTPTQRSSITSTITHQPPSVASSTTQNSSVTMVTTKPFSQTPKPEHVVPTTAGQSPQKIPSISGEATAVGMPSTTFSFTSTQQSSVTSATTHQSPSLTSSTTQKSSVGMVTTKPFSQTPKPGHVVGTTAGQPPQATSSITGQSSVMPMQTLVVPTTRQSLKTSVFPHPHIVILPPASQKHSKHVRPPDRR